MLTAEQFVNNKTKIVYNSCYGGFGLSEKGIELGRELSGDNTWNDYKFELDRADPILVQVVETLGDEANNNYSYLKIAELDKGTLYRIDEYDGMKSVMTIDDYNWEVA